MSAGLALIGTGAWGRRIAAAVGRTEGLHLVTCYSRDGEKREAFAREFGCEAAESFEAAAGDPRVAGVLLVTPNHTHREQAEMSARLGRHVLVEKPIADRVEDGIAMQRACEGVVLSVGHGFRRLGAARKAKEILDAGALGRVVMGEATFSLPGALGPESWRSRRETCPGGPLLQLGVHHADTLQYLLGPIRSVTGSFAHLATSAEIDDVGVAMLEFASGARGAIATSYVSPKTYALRLSGTEGVLEYRTEMSVWPNAERMDPATTLTLTTRSGPSDVAFEPRDMLADELEEFVGCMRGAAVPETGAREGIAALRVILAALSSHERGRPVSVEEV